MIRYPGSKRQFNIASRIASRRICEPFCGMAHVTFQLLREGRVDKVWLNDLDTDIYNLWRTVRDNPDKLCDLVDNYTPKPEDFYRIKNTKTSSIIKSAFNKIVIHQISYSGLGKAAGSPIGGRQQKGKYKVGCRWRSDGLIKKIKTNGELLNSVPVKLTNVDWSFVGKGFFKYIDPPYFVRGETLYKHGKIDHILLANSLKLSNDWLLSYDACSEIREAYSWAHIEELRKTSHLHHKSRPELLIYPRS